MKELPSVPEMEDKKIELYNEFYHTYESLFNSNRQEFMFEQMRYVENKMRDWIYKER